MGYRSLRDASSVTQSSGWHTSGTAESAEANLRTTGWDRPGERSLTRYKGGLEEEQDVPVAVIAGAAVFGAGFGVTQNASLALMYDRVPKSGYSAVSALWNLAYDGGMGLGAAAFGVLVVHTGYPAAFALTAAVLPVVLAFAGRRQGMPAGAEARTTSRSA